METDVYRIGTLLEMVRSAPDGPEHCSALVLKPDYCEHILDSASSMHSAVVCVDTQRDLALD